MLDSQVISNGFEEPMLMFTLDRFFQDPQYFEPKIMDSEYYASLLSVRENLCFAREVYFSEIDQYFFLFHCRLLKLLSCRIRSALKNWDDYITLAMITRQLIEIIYWSNTVVWVRNSCFNQFQYILSEKRDTVSYVLWPELEKFVLSINYWPQNATEMVARLVKEDIPEDFKFNDSKNFTPTIYIQKGILKYVADHWQNEGGIGFDISSEIAVLEEQYDYLSKFVHCTSQMFFPQKNELFLSSERITKSIENSFFLVLKSAMHVYKSTSWSDQFFKVGFRGLMRKILLPDLNNNMKPMVIEGTDIISGLFERFQGLSHGNSDKTIEIVKGRSISRKGYEIGLLFDSLSSEDKSRIEGILKHRSDCLPNDSF